MDMVAITKAKDSWYEVVGERRKNKGWIKAVDVVTDEEDVTTAILALKALSVEEGTKAEKIQAFVDTAPYPNSIFVQHLKQLIKSHCV